MINKTIFDFLTRLKNNNTKDWFDENRMLYTKLKSEFEQFIEFVIAEISIFDKDIAQTSAKASIYRINRDIRFSADKSPYKTNFGAYICKGGKKSPFAGYYIHVEPGACFLAGGIYMPSGEALKAIREEIHERFDVFKEIILNPAFEKNFDKELWGEKLKKSPKGFPADFEGIEYLKYKNYTVLKNEPDHIYWQNEFIDEVRSVFKTMMPFNRFLNRAVENIDNLNKLF